MSQDVQKFLDAKGVEVLWSQVNLNDYPNNETLIAILNAIDQTKADKVDVYTKAEVDTLILITPEDIDTICSAATNVNIVTMDEGVF